MYSQQPYGGEPFTGTIVPPNRNGGRGGAPPMAFPQQTGTMAPPPAGGMVMVPQHEQMRVMSISGGVPIAYGQPAPLTQAASTPIVYQARNSSGQQLHIAPINQSTFGNTTTLPNDTHVIGDQRVWDLHTTENVRLPSYQESQSGATVHTATGGAVVHVTGDWTPHPTVAVAEVEVGNVQSTTIPDQPIVVPIETAQEVIDQEPDPQHKLRRLTLCRWNDQEGFGFHLHSVDTDDRSSTMVGRVTEGGPAAITGLRVGDRIVEVGGVNMQGVSYEGVCDSIARQGASLVLLVADPVADRYYTSRGVRLHSGMPNVIDLVCPAARPMEKAIDKPMDSPPLKLVHLKKWENYAGYGFAIEGHDNDLGSFVISDVTAGSPAEITGVRINDHVIEINGVNIRNYDRDRIAQKVGENGDRVSLLLAPPETYDQFNMLSRPITATDPHIVILTCPTHNPNAFKGDMAAPPPPLRPQQSSGAPIRDYMSYSYATMLFCCMLIGCCAWSSSMKVRRALDRMDFTGAKLHSRNARFRNRLATAAGVLLWLAGIAALLVLLWQLGIINF